MRVGYNGDPVATPKAFCKYAPGQPIAHHVGFKVTNAEPHDWGETAERAEYLGVYPQVVDPTGELRAAVAEVLA